MLYYLVTITTELLNDIVPPQPESNNTQNHSKMDKIISHCRRLSFSKHGKVPSIDLNNNNSNSNNSINGSNNNVSKNDYRKDIEKLRKKYALVEEKPKSKYFDLMKMLDIKSTEKEFLALSSL